jgi:hypothetical protein
MSTPEEQARTMIANLPEKTGRSLEDWLVLTVPAPHAKHGALVKWLKTEHGISHGFANLIAHETLAARAGGAAAGAQGAAAADDDYAAEQYAGPKAGLRPIHVVLADAVRGFGDDVEFAPKKGYVSLRRKKQFALIQPSTKTRVDLGLQLKGREPEGRLEASGSFNAMVSHRVRLGAADEVDGKVLDWLRAAYDAAG